VVGIKWGPEEGDQCKKSKKKLQKGEIGKVKGEVTSRMLLKAKDARDGKQIHGERRINKENVVEVEIRGIFCGKEENFFCVGGQKPRPGICGNVEGHLGNIHFSKNSRKRIK